MQNEQDFIQQAEQLFGNTRTEELKPELIKLASDLKDIYAYPISIEDEL